ncbi:transcriptional regulator [Roseivivax halodurans JCM 10272]|uniref:Transcriptional regulator n=1 Tax=Roseivivax halodurans JCM 10272 TaxID=1449350 RepID=X7EEI7_9RHOB|nr:LysR family transcriptional regulator [Roseivivax halodurans]ETX13631.1 transcriptional regulator [Roseivivax halodurans JCM 10272]
MQTPENISLNAVRVFVMTAEAGSISMAAARLGVTPGAVSRQIQNLETSLGVSLFHRTNNALRLTPAGDRFFQESQPGLSALNRAISSVVSGDQALTVSVPLTLATRWLIPRLQDFRRRRPRIDASIETFGGSGIPSVTRADITIAYRPITAEDDGGIVLLEDLCRPYVSPRLLSEIDDPIDLTRIPALQASAGNWDWKAWLSATHRSDLELRYTGRFDLDEIALRAAVSGAGMALASPFLVQDDVDAGLLCPLPNEAGAVLGHYILRAGKPVTGASEAFVNWIRAVPVQSRSQS